MADVADNEYAGKSSEEKKELKDFLDCRNISRDYCRPYFEKAVRMYRLFAGHLPPEIKGTFSQVMLWFPYSIIDTELPMNLRAMTTTEDWLSLRAENYELEDDAEAAQKWLRHEMERVQQFPRTVIPTFQSANIFGNGYRWYAHKYVEREVRGQPQPNIGEMGVIDAEQPVITPIEKHLQSVITGEYINFFNVLPSPNGGMINPPTNTSEPGLDWLIVYLYPPTTWIEEGVEKELFDKAETERFLNNKCDPEEDGSMEFKDDLVNVDGAWNQFSAPEWVKKIKSKSDTIPQRKRVAFLFRRDKNTWTIIGDDKFVLYHGDPLLSRWPLANFKSSFNMDNFFGTSLLEVVEDLIISMILNFNMRLDYLAGKFHPPRFIPTKLIDDLGGDMSAFDWEPYKIIPYNHMKFPNGIGNYLHSDNLPELTEQAFLEQSQMDGYLQEIINQHNTESLNSNTATGSANMFGRDVARSMQRAINLDQTGVHDSAMLTLVYGAKFRNTSERIYTGAAGMPWEKIDHKAITDGYGITVNGARHLMQAEETFKRQLSMAPMFLQDPQMQPGIGEMKKQLLEQGRWRNIDLITSGIQPNYPTQNSMNPGPQMPGGIPSAQNDMNSTMNRSDGGAAGVSAV